MKNHNGGEPPTTTDDMIRLSVLMGFSNDMVDSEGSGSLVDINLAYPIQRQGYRQFHWFVNEVNIFISRISKIVVKPRRRKKSEKQNRKADIHPIFFLTG